MLNNEGGGDCLPSCDKAGVPSGRVTMVRIFAEHLDRNVGEDKVEVEDCVCGDIDWLWVTCTGLVSVSSLELSVQFSSSRSHFLSFSWFPGF